MTDFIIEAEKDFRNKHLISQNIANGSRLIERPHPGVSVFNFHYAKPPKTVPLNYHLNKVIGDNETGFNGIEDDTYRTEAWDFLLAGGGLFNHLDYSFTVGHEDGTFIFKEGQPGGGGKTLRNQFRILVDFMKDLDYIHMVPYTGFIKVISPENSRIQALVKEDEIFAAYINNFRRNKNMPAVKPEKISSEIQLDLPEGSYKIVWLDTKNAATETLKLEKHPGGPVQITSPEYLYDIALKISVLK
jgi:hypothetical protein